MRVLHAVWAMHAGGAERQLAYLAGELTRRGIETHVVVAREGILMPMLQSAGATIHRLAPKWNYDVRSLTRMGRLLHELRPDLVQTWLTQMDIIAGAAASVMRVPWILSERSAAPAYPPSLRHGLRAWIGGQAARIVSNSEVGAEYWKSRVADGKLAVVRNGIPVAAIDATPAAELPDAAGRPVVLFAGRLSREKGPDLFLSAMEALEGTVSGLMCGDGPERARIDGRIASSPILGRTVTRAPHEPNVWSLMRSVSAVVVPSRFEGHPNAVLEAMAIGTPLIVADIAAHRAFLDERTARFVPMEDPAALARAIREVLADPGAARERAERARSIVLRFSVEAMADSFLQIYESILGETRERRGSRSARRG